MISNSNFKFNATSKANFYIRNALRMVKLFKVNGNTPLTCKETSEIVGRSYQGVYNIAYYCDLFKVEKKKVGEIFTCIKTIYDPKIFRQDDGKFTVVADRYHTYENVEEIRKEGDWTLLYKTVPTYKTYISLSDEGINLV